MECWVYFIHLKNSFFETNFEKVRKFPLGMEKQAIFKFAK